MEKYRVDQYDSVYEYDNDAQAYVFSGKLNGEKLSDWIADYEQHYDEYND